MSDLIRLKLCSESNGNVNSPSQDVSKLEWMFLFIVRTFDVTNSQIAFGDKWFSQILRLSWCLLVG